MCFDSDITFNKKDTQVHGVYVVLLWICWRWMLRRKADWANFFIKETLILFENLFYLANQVTKLYLAPFFFGLTHY